MPLAIVFPLGRGLHDEHQQWETVIENIYRQNTSIEHKYIDNNNNKQTNNKQRQQTTTNNQPNKQTA